MTDEQIRNRVYSHTLGAMLAEMGIYPHHPNTEPAPLGATWILKNGEYHQIPNGTPAERDAAQLNAAKAAKQSERSRLSARRLAKDGARWMGPGA